MTDQRRVAKLDPGIGSHGKNPVIEYVSGPDPYFWIGDDDTCYGTLGSKELRRLLAETPDTEERER